jgi:putative spermidine/putrescine transport system permease protein
MIEKRRVPKNLAHYAPYLGVVPFVIFAIVCMVYPTGLMLRESFRDAQGGWTVQNYIDLQNPLIVEAYLMSIRISLTTAVIGGAFGLVVAIAIVQGGMPRWIQGVIRTFSGVAANYAGVPLAFAFVATIGRLGFVTVLLKSIGINIYASGFTLYSYMGLVVVYVYFQFPLMILVMTPALEALRREWREASLILGATAGQYWWFIARPILQPTVLAALLLLFGNAFGAFATAYALTGGTITMVTNVIAQQISGDVLHNEGLAYAMAMGMIVIMSITIAGYALLQRHTQRWLQKDAA